MSRAGVRLRVATVNRLIVCDRIKRFVYAEVDLESDLQHKLGHSVGLYFSGAIKAPE